MAISLSSGELFNIAIGIERRGVAFYDVMSKSTDDAATRNIFHYLAEMEREHVLVFRDMLGEADKHQTSETHSGEYAAHLQTLLDNAVFTDDMITSEMVTQVDSDAKAVELAIGAEKDSILFYYELKEVMTRRTQPVINKIIAEEKSHLGQLSELKKELTAA